MSNRDIYRAVASEVCAGHSDDLDACFEEKSLHINYPCYNRQKCRVKEKSEEQISYIMTSIDEHVFLEACPGSGKTEVVGMKAAYEMQRWAHNSSGLAVLSFTNTAADEISARIRGFTNRTEFYPHFIGTFDRWLHSYLVQPATISVKLKMLLITQPQNRNCRMP
ncbi:MAG: UvrD-helicase domain-containing protein [Bacillota bacterium]|nr:UvrD-helicase domain-containing protein [Bacillota bacterium]HHU62552.1 UvrD-helicase domain-containing protein [Natronincola sp.]